VDRENWHTECKGQIWAEVFGLKLIVRQSGTYARYVILRPSGSEGTRDEVMLPSGTEPNVNVAMLAAERVAMRTALLLRERRRSTAQENQMVQDGR
jgi:hypothetical protein